MTEARRERGRRAEEAAAEYLLRRRHVILARNYRCRVGEIDIVSSDGGALVFVEVRSRRDDQHGSGIDSIDYRKRCRLRRVAQAYLADRPEDERTVRFDVIGVTWRDGRAVVEHVENAFEDD